MAHVPSTLRLETRETIDAAVSTYGFTFAVGRPEDVRVKVNAVGDGDPDVDRRAFVVTLNDTRTGGSVRFNNQLQSPQAIALVTGQALRIYRDTEVRSVEAFPVQGYAANAAVGAALAQARREREELTARTESHADIIINQDAVKDFAIDGLQRSRDVELSDLSGTARGDVVKDVEYVEARNEIVVSDANDQDTAVPLPDWETGAQVDEHVSSVRAALEARIVDLEEEAQDLQSVRTIANRREVEIQDTGTLVDVPGATLTPTELADTSARLEIEVDPGGGQDLGRWDGRVSAAVGANQVFTNGGGIHNDNNEYQVRIVGGQVRLQSDTTQHDPGYFVTARVTSPDATAHVRIGAGLSRVGNGPIEAVPQESEGLNTAQVQALIESDEAAWRRNVIASWTGVDLDQAGVVRDFTVGDRSFTFSDFDYQAGNVLEIDLDTAPITGTGAAAARAAVIASLRPWTITLNGEVFDLANATISGDGFDPAGDTVTFRFAGVAANPQTPGATNDLEVSRQPNPGDYYTLDHGTFRWRPLAATPAEHHAARVVFEDPALDPINATGNTNSGTSGLALFNPTGDPDPGSTWDLTDADKQNGLFYYTALLTIDNSSSPNTGFVQGKVNQTANDRRRLIRRHLQRGAAPRSGRGLRGQREPRHVSQRPAAAVAGDLDGQHADRRLPAGGGQDLRRCRHHAGLQGRGGQQHLPPHHQRGVAGVGAGTLRGRGGEPRRPCGRSCSATTSPPTSRWLTTPTAPCGRPTRSWPASACRPGRAATSSSWPA